MRRLWSTEKEHLTQTEAQLLSWELGSEKEGIPELKEMQMSG